MPDSKQISLTNSNVKNMSRLSLLAWVNATVKGRYKNVEELCTGVAYCQMIKMLSPNSINLRKLKMNPNQEYEYLINLKLLQNALNHIRCDKQLPLERLAKGRFRENLEFLQWFKKFYDAKANKEGDKKADGLTEDKKLCRSKTFKIFPVKNGNNGKANNISPESIEDLQVALKRLEIHCQNITVERDYYRSKFFEIGEVLKKSVDWGKRVLATLSEGGTDACEKVQNKKAE